MLSPKNYTVGNNAVRTRYFINANWVNSIMPLPLYATLLLQIREAREAIKELETDGLA